MKSILLVCSVALAATSFGFVNGDDFTPGEFASYPNGYANVHDYTNDYTRTAVENYKGHEGATYIKWTKLGAKPYGRAWAMKFDMTKGFQLCAATSGNPNSPRATVPAMAGYLKSRGKDPICGINCDYFTYDANGPYTYTIADSQVLTKGQDKGGRFNVLLMETGDHKVKIGEVGRTDGKGAMLPIVHSYDVVDKQNPKLKVRNSVRTSIYHYPAKDGKVWRPINPAPKDAGDYYETYPVSLVGTGKDPSTGHDIVVLFEADGRDSSWSYGVIADVACQMLFDEGCTEVGEFDGGGSASFWAKETDSECGRSDGLVNKSTDGTARLVGNAVFIVAPETRSPVATINGINTYYDFDEVLLALAPNEPIVILGEAACTGACAFDRSCSVSGSTVGAKIVCASQPTVAKGVTVALKDVAFAAPNNTLSVANGAKASVAGAASLGVSTTEAAGFEVKEPLTGDVTVSCSAATEPGQTFGFSPLAPAALQSSVAHLKHATRANLAAEAVSDGLGGSILRWVPDAAFVGLTEREGYNFTNRILSVEVTMGAHVVSGTRKVRLTVCDLSGAVIGTVDKPLEQSGTYTFDTAETGKALDPRATYLCSVSVVTAAGEPVAGNGADDIDVTNGKLKAWFTANPSQVSGGAWNSTPAVEGGAYQIDSASGVRFTATDSAKTETVRTVSEMTFTSVTPVENLPTILDSMAQKPRSGLTLVEQEDGTLAWYGLVKASGAPAFCRLTGVPAQANVKYRLVQEVSQSASASRVRYGVAAGGGPITYLQDATGETTFAGVVDGGFVGAAEYCGKSTLHGVTGEKISSELMSVDGVGYELTGDAFAAANVAGKAITLITNVLFLPTDAPIGTYSVVANGKDLIWGKGSGRKVTYDAGSGELTIVEVAGGFILYIK